MAWFHLVGFGFGLALVASMFLETLIFSNRPFDFYFYFYFAVWTLLAAINLPFLKHLKIPTISWNLTLRFSAIILIVGSLLYKEYHSRAIWMDEMISMTNTLESDDTIVNTATLFHQPPTEQQIMLLFGLAAGYETWTVRGPTLICLILFLILFPVIVFQLTGSFYTTVLAALFYMANPYLLSYGVEGRPLQMGLLFLLLYYYTNHHWVEKKSRSSLVALWSMGLLLVLSINVQGVSMLFSVFAATLLVKNKSIPRLKHYVLTHLSLFLAYLPVFLLSKKSADSLNRISTDWLTSAINYMQQFSFHNFDLFFEGQIYLAPLAGLLLLGNVKLLGQQFYRSRAVITLLACLIFFVGLDFFNRQIMLWEFYIRYVLLFFLLFLILVINLQSHIEKQLAAKNRKFLFIFSLLVAAVFFPNQKYEQMETISVSLSDSTDIYSYLTTNTQPDDHIHKINLCHYGQWRQQPWFAARIYMPDDKFPQLKNPNDEIMISESLEHVVPYSDLISNREMSLVLVEEKRFTTDLYRYFRKMNNLVKYEIQEKNNIYHFILRKDQTLEDYENIFKTLAARYHDRSRLGYVYEVLFYLAAKKGNVDEMKEIQNRLKDLRPMVLRHNKEYRDLAVKELEKVIWNTEMKMNEF